MPRRARRVSVPLPPLLLLLVGGAAGALTPVAQDRHVHGENVFETIDGTFPFQETFAAPDFAPFVAETDGLPPELPGAPIASQDSQVGSESLHATGVSLSAPGKDLFVNHTQLSESLYRVEFDLAAPRTFTLRGQVDLLARQCQADSRGHIRLTGPSGPIAEVEDEIDTFPPDLVYCDPDCVVALPLDASGILPPGHYTLEAESSSDGYGAVVPNDPCENPYATSSFQVDLLLAAPMMVPASPTTLVVLGGWAMLACSRGALRRRSGSSARASRARA